MRNRELRVVLHPWMYSIKSVMCVRVCVCVCVSRETKLANASFQGEQFFYVEGNFCAHVQKYFQKIFLVSGNNLETLAI